MPRPSDMRENVFRDQIIELAERLGHRIYAVLDTRAPARRTLKGWPDLTIMRRTRISFAPWRLADYAELKDARRKATADQIEVLDMLASASDHVYLWRPKDWDGIAAWLAGQREYAPGRWVDLRDEEADRGHHA